MPSPSILVIGGASLDVLHFQGRTEPSAGGAGLYTALAAGRAGAAVTMFAPRPDPMPPQLAPATGRIQWIGPVVPPDQMPSFEIAHYGEGRAELVNARWGAELLISVDNLPDIHPLPDIAYSGPLADPARQLAFVRHFKALGCRTGTGTYWRAVSNHTDVVRETFETAELFFCNQREAEGLFGSLDAARTAPGRLLFITLSAQGALVIQGSHRTHVPGIATQELDPTGAGDTFCGTTCALLAQGWHPIQAARQAIAASARMIEGVGPSLLYEPLPPLPVDPRVAVNDPQVERIAALVAALPEAASFPFVGDEFPPPDHPSTRDYFFASTLQQFGFWYAQDGRYEKPMIASLQGRSLKGSDYLWAVYRRWLDLDPTGLTPSGHAGLNREDMADRFRSDLGDNPMPDFDTTSALACQYGQDLVALGWTPSHIIDAANASDKPLQTFLTHLDHVGGYKEDPLRKKSTLLAIILQQRPEHFLRIDPGEATPPIIDYHLQRSCLRTGLIDILDPALEARLTAREVLSPADEWAIRGACFTAIERLQRASGKSMGAVDWFFFGARRRCPEMTEPECAQCAVDPVCAHRKSLFQPVIRTSFY